ncbi:MAG: hypothetical protein H7259_03235, partial [Cytophagales bacterium]|nr:hypothetical protein [Cytophaga sp.]
MKYIRFAYLFFSILLICFSAGAGEYTAPVPEEEQATFNLNEIQKKGIHLSDLGLQQEGFQNLKIRHSQAIRIEEAYAPMDGVKPFNLPFAEIKKNVDRAHAALKEVKDNEM